MKIIEKIPYFSIPIDLLDPFPNHPFQVRNDEDMEELISSIRERGVIEPLILRKEDNGRYQIISGHRRKRACETLGITEVPAEVRDVDEDEAAIMLVDANLHRSHILPSEKAFAYKMRLEAMNRQGSRTDLTSAPLEQKLNSRKELAESVGESSASVQRDIRLTYLIKPLRDLVDEYRIAKRPAYELSFLSEREQGMLFDEIELTQNTPSHPQARRLRKLSEAGELNQSAIDRILREDKSNQKDVLRVRVDFIKDYIPPEVPFSQMENYIINALKHYKRYYVRGGKGIAR